MLVHHKSKLDLIASVIVEVLLLMKPYMLQQISGENVCLLFHFHVFKFSSFNDLLSDPFVLANYTSSMHSVMYNPVEPRLLATANAKEGVGLWDVRNPRRLVTLIMPIFKYYKKYQNPEEEQ